MLACNDLMAIGALEAAQERGCSVPNDVAVVGFDDIPACVWVRPHLTTIAQYPGEMGRLGVEKALARLQGERLPDYLPTKVDVISRQGAETAK